MASTYTSASTQSFNHSLLRPCVLHILRAAGYQGTRPSVLDTFTDIAGRYLLLLARSAANHAASNHTEVELCIEDVRMAMQECGALAPEKTLAEQIYDDEEDIRGVDDFLAWVVGPDNREIMRIALEGGEEGREDYLTALKKKHNKIGEETRYQGTLLGKPIEPRKVIVEGGQVTSIKEWAEKVRTQLQFEDTSADRSRQPSSDLSSIGDQDMEAMEF